MDNFSEFKLKLDSYDQQTWDILKTNIALVVLNWCRKEYLEPSWVVINGILFTEEEFAFEVYNKFRANYSKLYSNNITYSSLKSILIEITKDQLEQGFAGFLNSIRNNDNSSWTNFDNRIRKVLKVWIVKKGEVYQDVYDKIYSETIYVFFEKLLKAKLSFADSRNLKSYVIRISEFILKEHRRKKSLYKFLTTDDSHFIEIPVIQPLLLEVSQKKEQLKYLLNTLSFEEKKILYSVYFLNIKLKDIAGRLKLSEEACRVKKHRALKKLHEQIAKAPYFTDVN